MNKIREHIISSLEQMTQQNLLEISTLSDRASVTDYSNLVHDDIWTSAFQKAIDEHEWILIPAREKPYLIDDSLIIPSNRHIEAEEGAVIRQAPGVPVLLLRNKSVVDGTHHPEDPTVAPDKNISINGGRWEESWTERLGYGQSGMFDKDRSIFGVSTCMLFSNAENVTLTNMTFFHTAGFSAQFGNIKNLVCKNITFEQCFADGLHINGNTENALIRRISGQVGDDLVALNMYDWLNSSINFGPMKNVFCEDLTLSPDSHYKAFRIQPGFYRYDDGSEVDCSANEIVIRRVKGIKTYKMYLQTPSFPIGGEREYGIVGSGDNLFFEDIEADLDSPLDHMPDYMNSDPITGTFAVFEINANLGRVVLDNVHVQLPRDKYPYSYVLCVGPKSIRIDDREIFDPEHSSKVQEVSVRNLTVNGVSIEDPSPYLREIVFEKLYGEEIYGQGEIGKITSFSVEK